MEDIITTYLFIAPALRPATPDDPNAARSSWQRPANRPAGCTAAWPTRITKSHWSECISLSPQQSHAMTCIGNSWIPNYEVVPLSQSSFFSRRNSCYLSLINLNTLGFVFQVVSLISWSRNHPVQCKSRRNSSVSACKFQHLHNVKNDRWKQEVKVVRISPLAYEC